MFLVLTLTYEVVSRYVFNAPTIWSYDVSCMLGGTFAVLGWAYTHRYNEHVRVDVIYLKLSPRGKAIVDAICWFLLFSPLLVAVIHSAARQMLFSWAQNEVSAKSFWYPPMGPIRTLFFYGVCLFALQSLVQFIRDLRLIITKEPYD